MKVTTRAELIDLIENIRAVEVIARRGYAEDTQTFVNFEILDAIGQIKADEDNHIALLDEILSMLRKKI